MTFDPPPPKLTFSRGRALQFSKEGIIQTSLPVAHGAELNSLLLFRQLLQDLGRGGETEAESDASHRIDTADAPLRLAKLHRTAIKEPKLLSKSCRFHGTRVTLETERHPEAKMNSAEKTISLVIQRN